MSDEKEDWKVLIARWAFGQPFNNILLMAILVAIGYSARYLVITAIPAHLHQIQDGYEKIIDTQCKEQQRLTEAYDRWFELKRITVGKEK